LNPLQSRDFFKYPDVFIAGSHILVYHAYIDLYLRAYKETVKKYVNAECSVISDQHVMATMVGEYQFITPILCDDNNNCPDKWFFFFTAI
jgi:hypothetical protein